MCLVGKVGRHGQGKCVEDGSFGVRGVLRCNLGHCVTVGVEPGLLGYNFESVVEAGSGSDVVALALCPRSGLRGRRNCRAALIEGRACLQSGREWVAPTAERNSPIGHSTPWVGYKSLPEFGNCRAELKRVEQRHSVVKGT